MSDFYAGRQEPKEVDTHVLEMPTFLRARHAPDVPEDVEDDIYLHLNDPNYDLRSLRSSRSSTSFELDNKKKSFAGDSVDFSSEADTESHLGTTTRGADSQAPLHEEGYDDESPYPEVRAAVSNVDDPLMPVNTFRAWFLGIFISVTVSALNQAFGMRYPSIWIEGLVIQLTVLPMGKALEYILPRYRFNTLGYVWSFNPGPFSIKEHVLITIMGTVVTSQGAPASDIIATQRMFYNQNFGFGYDVLLLLSTQLIGYSFAGLTRQFLVWPNSMIWPGSLVNAALFNSLHKGYGKRERGHMTRERFLLIVLGCSFVWYFVPGYLFTALSTFNWICWIAPNNLVVNQLFGTMSGLGMSVVTLDWSQISFVVSPLVVPWWAQVNTFVSFVMWFWVLTPILYYRNVWFSKFMPISSSDSYDNTGASYDAMQIITDGQFDLEKYQAYSPLFLSPSFAISYGVSFAAVTAVAVHTFLWYGRDIRRQMTSTSNQQKDVHSRLMAKYPEVPHFWYGLLFIFSFVLGIVAIEKYDTHMPFWAYLVALLLSLSLVIPTGIIVAITNQSMPMGVLAEVIGGYILPGRPVAVMIFKTFGYFTTLQATTFAGDLKLGHYMKIPPRTMFMAQTVSQFISAIIVVATQAAMFAAIPDMCTPDQKHGFTCPGTNTFATASLIWGGIGPQRLFSRGSLYHPLLYFFLLGAVAPIPFYFLARRYPHAIWRYINMPVFFTGVYYMPPATGINYSSWFAVGFVFQWFVRRFHFRWWMRYNYLLSAGLDAGVAFGFVAIFFFLTLPKNGSIGLNTIQAWWGNTVYLNTLDAQGAPAFTVGEGETFGPLTW